MAQKEIRQQEQKIDFEKFRKAVPIKLDVSRMNLSEEEVLQRIHSKIEKALSGETVYLRLAGPNALLLRDYINENFAGVRAKAFEREGEALWFVKVEPREAVSHAPAQPKAEAAGVLPSRILPPPEVALPGPKVQAKGVDAVLDSADAEFFRMGQKNGWPPEEYRKCASVAREQAKWFIEKSGLAGMLSDANLEQAAKNLFVSFMEYSVSSKALEKIAAEVRAAKPEIEREASSLASCKGADNRFCPGATVSDQDIKYQVVSAHVAKSFVKWKEDLMLPIANYETRMAPRTKKKHGRGPMQITSSSVFSDAKDQFHVDNMNKYLPEGIVFRKKLCTLDYVSNNVLSNYMAGAETLVLKWHRIMNSANKENRRIQEAVRQAEGTLGREFRIGDVESLPEEIRLLAYKRLAYYYNGNPAVRNGYAKALYTAVAKGEWKGKEIDWLAELRKGAPAA